MQFLRLTAALLAALACNAAQPAESPDLAARWLAAMRPVPESGRQKNAGVVLRDFKAAGLIPFKPDRVDYTDYYPVLKPLQVLGHDLVIVEEEYMARYVGCCVSEGAGMVLRLHGDTKRLEAFAQANKCSVEKFKDAAEYRDNHMNVRFPLPAGAYAALSCRARDEER